MTREHTYPLHGKRVWVAGHRGLVGSALVRRLASEGCQVLTATRAEVDLKDQAATAAWLERERPDAVFLAAAKVGGIMANSTYPADFLYDNLIIAANVIHAAHHAGVEKLVFLGSSCIYPKFAPQPIEESSLLTGPLEPTNEWYAIAKIAGLKLCQAYRTQHGRRFVSAMPTNLYGPFDNFDPQSSHVIPGLMRKAHEAKVSKAPTMTIWGSGTPRREFMHVDDCADALVLLMQQYEGYEPVNVGSGTDLPIRELTEIVADVVGFRGEILLDRSKPDGTPRKLMSGGALAAMGWRPSITLHNGLAQTYRWYLEALTLDQSLTRVDDGMGEAQIPSSGHDTLAKLPSGGKKTSKFDVFPLLATKVAAINPDTFLQIIENYFSHRGHGTGSYVVFRDVHGLVRSQGNADLEAAHDAALVVAPDGIPLVWAARLHGFRTAARVCGPDSLQQLCAAGVSRGWRHVFFGSTPETLELLVRNLEARYPGIIIADAISPPYRAPDVQETADQIARIRKAEPDFVWVGLGSPKQDLWMFENAAKIPGALCMGVGAAFDMAAGRVRRAPLWAQHFGLEWAYRVVQEPRRLWRRYATVVPRFVVLAATETVRTRLGRF